MERWISSFSASTDLAEVRAAGRRVRRRSGFFSSEAALPDAGADAAFFDESVVRDFAKASDGGLTVVGPLYEGQSYGIGFPKGSKLVGPVNEALKAMKADGTYKQLYIKWFGVDPDTK